VQHRTSILPLGPGSFETPGGNLFFFMLSMYLAIASIPTTAANANSEINAMARLMEDGCVYSECEVEVKSKRVVDRSIE